MGVTSGPGSCGCCRVRRPWAPSRLDAAATLKGAAVAAGSQWPHLVPSCCRSSGQSRDRQQGRCRQWQGPRGCCRVSRGQRKRRGNGSRWVARATRLHGTSQAKTAPLNLYLLYSVFIDINGIYINRTHAAFVLLLLPAAGVCEQNVHTTSNPRAPGRPVCRRPPREPGPVPMLMVGQKGP